MVSFDGKKFIDDNVLPSSVTDHACSDRASPEERSKLGPIPPAQERIDFDLPGPSTKDLTQSVNTTRLANFRSSRVPDVTIFKEVMHFVSH